MNRHVIAAALAAAVLSACGGKAAPDSSMAGSPPTGNSPTSGNSTGSGAGDGSSSPPPSYEGGSAGDGTSAVVVGGMPVSSPVPDNPVTGGVQVPVDLPIPVTVRQCNTLSSPVYAEEPAVTPLYDYDIAFFGQRRKFSSADAATDQRLGVFAVAADAPTVPRRLFGGDILRASVISAGTVNAGVVSNYRPLSVVAVDGLTGQWVRSSVRDDGSRDAVKLSTDSTIITAGNDPYSSYQTEL